MGDGFPGQRMFIVPARQVRHFLQDQNGPGVAVAACGFFPRAARHALQRSTPSTHAIIIACLAGEGWCTTSAGTFAVHPGEILLLPPGLAHAYGASEANPWTLWWVHLAGRHLLDFLAGHGIDGSDPVRSPAHFLDIAALISQIARVVESDPTPTSMLRSAGVAWHLLGIVASDRSAIRGPLQAIEDAATTLRENPADALSVADLAAATHLSVSHFAKVFRRRFGVSVVEYQTQVRMARARELLDNTNLTVRDVGRAVGYTDQLYFSRRFRSIHGIPPSAYKSGNRGEMSGQPNRSAFPDAAKPTR